MNLRILSSLPPGLPATPQRAARPSAAPDQVELSSPPWSPQDRQALEQRLGKLETLSLKDPEARKRARQVGEQSGKTPREAGAWLERLAVSASSKGLLSFYYERFWEDVEALGLEDDERRDHYLGMLERLFGDQSERRMRWDLIDNSQCGQPWAERALTMGALVESGTLRGLSRTQDCQRAFGCWESAVQAGGQPATMRKLVVSVADDLVSGNWSDPRRLQSDFTRLERSLVRLAGLPAEVQAAALRSGHGFDTLCLVLEHPELEPAARLLPVLSKDNGPGWLATFQALIDSGLDPVAASFVVQEHLRQSPDQPGPEDPVAEAARLRGALRDSLGLPAQAPSAGIKVGPKAITVGSVRVPVRR